MHSFADQPSAVNGTAVFGIRQTAVTSAGDKVWDSIHYKFVFEDAVSAAGAFRGSNRNCTAVPGQIDRVQTRRLGYQDIPQRYGGSAVVGLCSAVQCSEKKNKTRQRRS